MMRAEGKAKEAGTVGAGPRWGWRAGGTSAVLLTVALAAACSGSGNGDAAERQPQVDSAASETWAGDVGQAARSVRPQEGTEEDWQVFRRTVTWAWEQGLDTVPMGEAMVRIGESFLGTPYAAGTLEVAGEEDVVVNFTAFDCVTFVENVLALSRFVRMEDPGVLDSDLRSRELYRGFLREIRYRGGRVEGYPSRLHYFSDWIQDNEAKGIVREVTQDLGGYMDPKAIDFMSMHPEAYRQLADPANLRAIEDVEFFLSGLTRYKIPEDDIAGVADGIRDGDIIAATSTEDGLDVAHTGLAVWQGGELHLLNAPLVGGSVEIGEHTLADRILLRDTQDGIRVVRPVDPRADGGAAGGR